jgi:hypothetical protein
MTVFRADGLTNGPHKLTVQSRTPMVRMSWWMLSMCTDDLRYVMKWAGMYFVGFVILICGVRRALEAGPSAKP